ncbi:MAG: hypothetical protein WC617_02095 [Rhodanobacter sp.]|jgi:hypothetical protein
MQQFIPFEDDWDALEKLRPEDFIPYRFGLLPQPAAGSSGSSAPAGFPGACAYAVNVSSSSHRLHTDC